jgi:hypothetical protein
MKIFLLQISNSCQIWGFLEWPLLKVSDILIFQSRIHLLLSCLWYTCAQEVILKLFKISFQWTVFLSSFSGNFRGTECFAYIIIIIRWRTARGGPWPPHVGFRNNYFLQGEVVSLTPNHQPGGPGYPLLSGSSHSTCPARVALPVADATAGTALRIIWPRKPSHPALAFDKVEIPWRGSLHIHIYYIARDKTICRNPLSQNFTGDRKKKTTDPQ